MAKAPIPPDQQRRIQKIIAILTEESVASYLPYELGVTLEGEARVIDIVRGSPGGKGDLAGYLIGVAPGANSECLSRAAARIVSEVE